MAMNSSQLSLCSYYQAQVNRELVWFMVATLRSFEHLCFDRTLLKDESVFEFFVPQHNEQLFVELMNYYQNESIITKVQKLPNRLLDADQEL